MTFYCWWKSERKSQNISSEKLQLSTSFFGIHHLPAYLPNITFYCRYILPLLQMLIIQAVRVVNVNLAEAIKEDMVVLSSKTKIKLVLCPPFCPPFSPEFYFPRKEASAFCHILKPASSLHVSLSILEPLEYNPVIFLSFP